MDIAEFLLARIAENEELAREADRVYVHPSAHDPMFGARKDDQIASRYWDQIADPDRVLAECEAKRRILAEFPVPVPHYRDELDWWRSCPRAITAEEAEGTDLAHGPDVECGCTADAVNARGGPLVLRLLALPYADHPEFREEWSPLAATPGG